MRIILLTILLFGCQKNEAKKHDEPIERLQLFYDIAYNDVLNNLDPVNGWINNDDCDGTLWNGLACSLGMPVRIDLAEYAPGEIHRRPAPSCYTKENGDQGSKSTVSRDMLTGYMSCLWERKDLAGLKRLADYGEDNAWIMGKPETMTSRVYLGANLTSLLGQAIYSLSDGGSDRDYRRINPVHTFVTEDYARHIQVQGILLYEKVNGNINDNMLEILKHNLNSNSEDPLFMAAVGKFTGDQKKTVEFLMENKTPCPGYARGSRPDIYCQIGWLQASKIVLDGAR
jgi:hypothetical protein